MNVFRYRDAVVISEVEDLDYQEGGQTLIAIFKLQSGSYISLDFHDFSDLVALTLSGNFEESLPLPIKELLFTPYPTEEGIFSWLLVAEDHFWSWNSEFPVDSGAESAERVQNRILQRDARYRFKRWFHKLFRRSAQKQIQQLIKKKFGI